jgi:hypothetical protein
VPWLPELFSAPVLARIEDEQRREKLDTVPFFAALMAGETDALIQSFAGEPEFHHPVRGRIKGAGAFADYVTETNAWLEARNVRSRASAGTPTRLLSGGLVLQHSRRAACVTALQRSRRSRSLACSLRRLPPLGQPSR